MTDHHTYALVFDDGSTQTITASGPTEAVALREGAPHSPRPHTMTDLTAMADFGRSWSGLRARLGLTDSSTVDEDRPIYRQHTGGPA